MSRTDDIINVAGHRLSTGAIEEVLSEHQSVAECAVIGIKDQLKGQLPIGLIALKAGVSKDNETISKECVQMVRDKVGPVAAATGPTLSLTICTHSFEIVSLSLETPAFRAIKPIGNCPFS